jgi:hypothetical protein
MKTIITNIGSMLIFIGVLLVAALIGAYCEYRFYISKSTTKTNMVIVENQLNFRPTTTTHTANNPGNPDTSNNRYVDSLITDTFIKLSVKDDIIALLKQRFDTIAQPFASSFLDTMQTNKDSCYSLIIIEGNLITANPVLRNITHSRTFFDSKLTVYNRNQTVTIPPNDTFWGWIVNNKTLILLGVTFLAIFSHYSF